MNELTNSEIEHKISREVIEYLVKNPDTPRHKITNLKGKFGKRYHYPKVVKNFSL